MTAESTLYYLLRVGLGLDEPKPIAISNGVWAECLSLAKRQAVVGLLFAGAERMPKASLPPDPIAMKLMSAAMQIRRANAALSARCAEITSQLAAVGLETCVLKGQGAARRYPDPSLRAPGDIDLWTRPAGVSADADIDSYLPQIFEALRRTGLGQVGRHVYHHVEWEIDKNIEVEIHYRTSWSNYPKYDVELHRWSASLWHERRLVDGFYVPSAVFDAVYMMYHIYRHLLFEGVGLRQVIDYAMLLQGHDFNADERRRIADGVEALGMKRFARALMWVLSEVLHIPDDKLLFAKDAREGAFFLDEIMLAGNFGKFDKRIDHRATSTLGRFWVRTKHRARFITLYPTEIIWDIPFRFRHFLWRRKRF